MSRVPIPIEVMLSSGLVLRGHEYAADGPTVVLVHDLGGDLDAWGSVPPDVSTAGFRVLCLELRGHGLSDGEVDPAATFDDLGDALRTISDAFGPVAFVSTGVVANCGFALSDGDGVPVSIAVSPVPGEDSGLLLPAFKPAMRALIAGAKDPVSDPFLRSIYPRLPGQNMWFSTGTDATGAELLAAHPHLVEQLVMFIRRYLTAYQLAWIAERTASGDIVARG